VPKESRQLTSVEICAGAGGQAYGLELAGFEHLALVENDPWCCATLRARRAWRDRVRELSVKEWKATAFRGGVDLFAGGVPCPPFSRAGQRLGADDERDLFPTAIELIGECRPRAVMLENVRGLLAPEFTDYRARVIEQPLREFGLVPRWKLLQASDYGVPQLRPRVILVALDEAADAHFAWPRERPGSAPTVGQALRREMARGGWPGAAAWAARADSIAPTLVGGSKKHGGPDLGPTQAKKQWAAMGVNAHLVAEKPPTRDFPVDAHPTLSVTMAAVLQGFPPSWPFQGKKTAAYRQVGNAFPPPVAEAVGRQIASALRASEAELGGAAILAPERARKSLAA
jgi:DNA (cytosine-5)-methyltransferase 1